MLACMHTTYLHVYIYIYTHVIKHILHLNTHVSKIYYTSCINIYIYISQLDPCFMMNSGTSLPRAARSHIRTRPSGRNSDGFETGNSWEIHG